MNRARICLAPVAGMLVLVGCRDSGGPKPPAVASILVSPSDTTVLTGSQYSLSVTALGPNGTALAVQPRFSYLVDNAEIATVRADGLVSTVRAGTATITVNVNGGGIGIARTATVRVGRDIGN